MRSPAVIALAFLLPILATPRSAASQQPVPPPGEDFPADDYAVWLFLQEGLKRRAADLALERAPGAPETFELLVDAGRIGDALAVLRWIVERHPERMGAAFKVAAEHGHQFGDQARGYPSALRDILQAAERRLGGVPREQAAESAFHLRAVANSLPGGSRVPWPQQLRAFLVEYPDTEASRHAEVRLLTIGRDLDARIAALETYARANGGTASGAHALFQAGWELAHNVPVTGLEPRGADPTERLLRLMTLVRELQSGAYPDCEWVRRAPELVIEFFAGEPQYAPASVPRLISALRDFLPRQFDVTPGNALSNGVGYFVAGKLPLMLAAGGGDPVLEVDRFLLGLEPLVVEGAAVRYVRGLWYRQAAEGANEQVAVRTPDPKRRDRWRRDAEAILLELARAGTGVFNRRALASLASIKFRDGDCRGAVARYREFASRFPQSGWVWVARLRQGQCEQFLGHWREAREVYASAAAQPSAPPPARVLGHAFAGRASEALGDFAHARAAYEAAERAWEPRFASPYDHTYEFQTRLDGGPCVACDARSQAAVSREWLRRRVVQLRRSASLPGGALLERGRFHVAEGAWAKAVTPLHEFIRQYPQSAAAAEAGELRVRAGLELELLRAGPDASDEQKRVVIAALDQLSAEPYGFAVFAAQVARATLHAMLGSADRGASLMSDALDRWHEHGATLFAGRPATALEEDVLGIREALFHPYADWPRHQFRHLQASDSPPPFLVAARGVRVSLHDDSVVQVQAASRLAARRGMLLLDEDQIGVLVRVLAGLGGTKRRVPQAVMEVPNQPIGGVVTIQRFWNQFFTMGPGHWGGWILETFPIVTEVAFLDADRTRAAAKIRTGYNGSTELLAKRGGTWTVTGSTGHWIE